MKRSKSGCIIIFCLIILFCFCITLQADLSDSIVLLQQSLNELKTNIEKLSKSLRQVKAELEDLKPLRTFEEISKENHGLILRDPYQYNNFTVYDIKVLPQRFKQTVKDHLNTNLWLHTINPQFAREGWLCGFHSIKNALYLAKLLTFPSDTYKQNEKELIARLQGSTHFFKYVEWPKSFMQQPHVEIPLNIAQLGRKAVLEHLAQERPWEISPTISWGLSWLKQRVAQQYKEASNTATDVEMQYRPESKPALYSIMYNPLSLPDDIINLTQSMRLGNTVATKFMKRSLGKTIIIHTFYPQNTLNPKFSSTDLKALSELCEKFNSSQDLLVPIIWSYETSLGNHWVTLVINKKEASKEILLADADIHGTSHFWNTQNNALIQEIIKILTNKSYIQDMLEHKT